MSDLDHRIFTWRPEIRSRREAAPTRVVLRAMDAELEQLSGRRARGWYGCVVVASGLPAVLELRRWLEHGSASALQQQYNAQEPRP